MAKLSLAVLRHVLADVCHGTGACSTSERSLSLETHRHLDDTVGCSHTVHESALINDVTVDSMCAEVTPGKRGSERTDCESSSALGNWPSRPPRCRPGRKNRGRVSPRGPPELPSRGPRCGSGHPTARRDGARAGTSRARSSWPPGRARRSSRRSPASGATSSPSP